MSILDEESLGPLTEIGRGGQGVVYSTRKAHLNGLGLLAYKKYHQSISHVVSFDVLASMIGSLSEMGQDSAYGMLSRCGWPVALVRSHGVFSGFLMPMAPEEFVGTVCHASGLSTEVVCRLEFLLNAPNINAYRLLELPDEARLSLLHHAATTLAILHDLGVRVPDLSAKNILYTPNLPCRSFLVDCDSMEINGRVAHRAGETVDWSVAQYFEEKNLDVGSDRYKFGLLVLRVLTRSQSARLAPRQSDAIPRSIEGALQNALSVEVEVRTPIARWRDLLAATMR